MTNFTYSIPATRVIFGHGTIETLVEEADALTVKRALVISTAQQTEHAKTAAEILGSVAVKLFSGAVMHTPEDVTVSAINVVRECKVDGLVAIGGGSTIGLGKAVALRTGLPLLAVPTTYAGSEMTPILGQSKDGIKTTIRDPRTLPKAVIYDIDLTLDLPAVMSAVSGLNAIAHAVESTYTNSPNPIQLLIAEEGIRSMYRGLIGLLHDRRNVKGRADALCGAWLCGTCLTQSSMALHHKLCHVLGGAFNLPHAETHAIVLPHVMAYNMPAAAEAFSRIKRAIGHEDPSSAFFSLAAAFKVPLSLREIGMPFDGIDRALELTLKDPYWNPRPLECLPLRNLIHDAWQGTRPPSALR
jgi:maleylacetate reductase